IRCHSRGWWAAQEATMRRTIMIFTFAACCFMRHGAEAVDFNVRPMQTHPSPDSLLATCRQQGGTYTEGPGHYSCAKQCTSNAGCSVNCTSDGCKSRTPARIAPTGRDVGVEDILNAGSSRHPNPR